MEFGIDKKELTPTLAVVPPCKHMYELESICCVSKVK